ncbi:SDR family oxidoreductase [Janthinobacterium sp. TB1-E2]|uniref:NAD dependent epimerase/dehydratase family protein n=2 Tax=Janthinobacterium TaxID=29580 RepID=A0AB38CC30_9BURK|nr:SDR family oxidoreductase [Janthinobacterium lividum]SFX97527.1 NAD dependent epimerase/dehydratase family protein [Janthinobacterium lividum]
MHTSFNPHSFLVTGASGFVGRALTQYLGAQAGTHVVCAARRHIPCTAPNMTFFQCNDALETQDWHTALNGVEVVIHLAARVHVMQDTAASPADEFRRINVQGSINVARQAADAGTRRFIFISSLKVNGEQTRPGHPFQANDAANPQDPYGISKHEAEQALLAIGRETGMEIVILRPPLIYGPGVRANFERLMRLVQRGVPLPFGAVHNVRSMVALENFVDLIALSTWHAQAPGKIFLVSDDHDVSIAQLLRMLAKGMKKYIWLIPIPPALIVALACLAGKSMDASRLLDSLQVDISETKRTLNWQPPYAMQEAINKTVTSFISKQ